MQNKKYLAIAFALITSSTNVIAIDYAAGASIDMHAVHDDNFRLAPDDKTVIYGVESTPKLLLGINSEADRFNIDTTLRSVRYNESDFNTDDQYLLGGYSHLFERSSVGLNADVTHDSTNTSEVTSSGRVGNKAERREHYRLSPSWQYMVTEKSLVGLSGSYSKDNYQSDNYIGFDSWDASLNWTYSFNERLNLMARVNYSDYHTEDRTLTVPYYFNFGGALLPIGTTQQTTSTETSTKGLLAGLQYAWSEQQSVSVLVGRSRNNTDFTLDDPQGICKVGFYVSGLCERENQSGNELTTDISWQQNSERQQFSLSVTKSTQPTSDGQAADQLLLNSSWSYSLTELQNIKLDLQGVRNRQLQNASERNLPTTLNRDYASAEIEYIYKLTETWRITTSYLYRFQEYPDFANNNIARAQVVTLGVRYQPTEWHWSR